MYGRLLEIEDEDIKQCIKITNDWYSLCSILYNIGIKQYKLWIGTLRWGDNETKDIVACLNHHRVFFKRDNEISYDLVSMMIHSWECCEPIDLKLNNTIEKTFYILGKYTKFNTDEILDVRCRAPYWYHDGNIKDVYIKDIIGEY